MITSDYHEFKFQLQTSEIVIKDQQRNIGVQDQLVREAISPYNMPGKNKPYTFHQTPQR